MIDPTYGFDTGILTREHRSNDEASLAKTLRSVLRDYLLMIDPPTPETWFSGHSDLHQQEALWMIALYIHRFSTSKNPFWIDEAAIIASESELPTLNTLLAAQRQALETRAKQTPRQAAQCEKYFKRAKRRDFEFLRLAGKIICGARIEKELRVTVNRIDKFSGGKNTIKSSTLEKAFSTWQRVDGSFWCDKLKSEHKSADAAQAALLNWAIQDLGISEVLPRGLIGKRR